MGQALRDAGVKDARIWAIDHFIGSGEHKERLSEEGGSTLEAFRHNIRYGGVDQFVNEVVMKSADGAHYLREQSVLLRMLFIDGAHDEVSVREDIKNFLPLMQPDGIIALHDCVPEGGFVGVWKAYESDLKPRVVELGRASSLLVTRLRPDCSASGGSD
jgi:predicted O-methyltransferase YrrM